MTINYELGKPRKDGSRKVSILVCQGTSSQNRKRLPTDVLIEKNELTKAGKIRNDAKLCAIESFIIKVKEGLIKERGTILSDDSSAVAIANKVKKVNDSMDFITFAESWIEKSTMKGKKNYSTFLNSLIKFNGSKQLSFGSVTYEYLDRYCRSLADRPRAQSMYLACFKHIWNQADKMYEDVIPRSPFRRFEIPRQVFKGQRAVDIDVIRKIYDYKGDGRAELARDCYILSFCLCGMNAVDLYNADTVKAGKICYERTKTKDRRYDRAYMEVTIPNIIKPLMKKYKGKDHVFCFAEHFKNPDAFSRAINIGLGIIFGVEKDPSKLCRPKYKGYKSKNCPTMYTARHSWATIARNDCNISKDVVNDALAHVDKDMRVTDLYIKKSYKHVDKANAKVIKFVFRK